MIKGRQGNCRLPVIRRDGLTLLEVIVGLVLMGSILVASLLGFSKHRRQLQLAEKRIQATFVADGLVQELSAQRGGIPVPAQGAVPGQSGWIWKTSAVGTTVMASIPMQVIRLELIDTRDPVTPLISVDLVKRSPQTIAFSRETFFVPQLSALSPPPKAAHVSPNSETWAAFKTARPLEGG